MNHSTPHSGNVQSSAAIRSKASPLTLPAALRFVMPTLALVISLLPVLNIVRIIATVGADNPSLDFLLYVPMIDRILDGTYTWYGYFFDTLIWGSHSMALPFALRLAVVKLTAWDMRTELYLVVFLTLLRLFVLHKLLTQSAPPLLRWLMLPLLAALLFSTSQVDTFTYSDAGLQLSLIQLGFTVGLWALVRSEGRIAGVAGMAAAGVLASLSGGGGLAVWPVFLVGLVALGYRRASHFRIWSAGAFAGFLPYAYYVVVQPNESGRRTLRLIPLEWFVTAIGWPFANGIATDQEVNLAALGAGLVGVVLFAITIALLWSSGSRQGFRSAVPGLLIVLMGFASVAVIGIFRSAINPWYTTPFMSFWIGLLGLTVPVWVNWKASGKEDGWKTSTLQRVCPFWAVSVPLVVAALYFNSNLTFEDKSTLLPFRSPASASALRNYRTAPTHYSRFLIGEFPYFPAVHEVARILEKHRISVFARRQTWALQGDFALNTVTVEEAPSALPVRWCDGPGGPVLPWSDYHHLDLRLHGGDRVSWRITIPEGTRRAELRTAIATSPHKQEHAAGWRLSVSGQGSADAILGAGELGEKIGEWRPLAFPLERFAGKEITLNFVSTGDAASAFVLFRFPHLELDLSQPPRPILPDEISPTNTERSPDFPQDSPSDLTVDVRRPDLWHLDAPLMGVSNGIRLYPAQSAQLRPQLNAVVDDFSHLKVEAEAGAEMKLPALRVYFGLESPNGVPSFPFDTIILLPNRRSGAYTYDLRLLEAAPGTRLQTLWFFSPAEDGPIRITGCRLLRKAR